jgi:hypothetical protein
VSLANPTHKAGCLCPVCRRARGEVTKTKKQFNTTLNSTLLTNLRNACKTKGLTLTEALEQAVENWLEDESEQFTEEALLLIEEGRIQARRGETEPLEKVAQELGYYEKTKRH